MARQYDAVIVGAGFGGMGAAIQLKRLGLDNIAILEREDDLGGTWHVNHYPGLAVDITILSIVQYRPMSRTKATAGRPRAYIYLRFSADDTERDETLAPELRRLGVKRHERECRALAEKLGVDVVAVFTDNDVSASKYSRKVRKDYRKMLAALDAGGADIVIAWHPDRLHRQPIELEEYIELSDKHGFDTHTVQAGLWNLSSPAGRMQAGILVQVARYESDHRSERVKSQKADRAAAGLNHGSRRPFGFEADGTTWRTDEAAVIRECATSVAAGVSARQLARDLNMRGVLTAGEGAYWTATGLSRVLRSPRVAGLRAYRGEVIGQAAWEPIVPLATWHACCSALDERDARGRTEAEAAEGEAPRQRTWGRTPFWLGSSLYVCGACGQAKMHVGQSGNTTKPGANRAYRCEARRAGQRTDVQHVHASALRVDQVVEDAICARLARPDVLEALRRTKCSDRSEALEKELAELEAEEEEAALLYTRKEVTGKQLMVMNTDIQERIEAVTRRLAVVGTATPFDGLDAGRIREQWFGTREDRSDGVARARRRAILDELVTVTILPTSKRGNQFDVERVQFDWKGGI